MQTQAGKLIRIAWEIRPSQQRGWRTPVTSTALGDKLIASMHSIISSSVTREDDPPWKQFWRGVNGIVMEFHNSGKHMGSESRSFHTWKHDALVFPDEKLAGDEKQIRTLRLYVYVFFKLFRQWEAAMPSDGMPQGVSMALYYVLFRVTLGANLSPSSDIDIRGRVFQACVALGIVKLGAGAYFPDGPVVCNYPLAWANYTRESALATNTPPAIANVFNFDFSFKDVGLTKNMVYALVEREKRFSLNLE
jgi:hypothetical protein